MADSDRPSWFNTMIAALLFSDSPIKAALMFLGAYVLGITAALGSRGLWICAW